MGATKSGQGLLVYELSTQDNEDSLLWKLSKKKFWHDPASLRPCCRKVSYPGFLPGQFCISMQQYYIALASVSLFIHINKDTKFKEIQYVASYKFKSDQGKILGESLCSRVAAEKLGHVNLSFDLILNSRDLSLYWVQSSYTNRPCPALMAPATDLISVFQLFTWREDMHSTSNPVILSDLSCNIYYKLGPIKDTFTHV